MYGNYCRVTLPAFPSVLAGGRVFLQKPWVFTFWKVRVNTFGVFSLKLHL